MPTLQELLQKTDACKGKGACSLNYNHSNFKAAFDYILDLSKQQSPVVSEELILKLHRLVSLESAASPEAMYRNLPAALGDSDFQPPSPEDVPRLMNHLADQIHSSRTTLHPVELAAMAYKRLVDIHPFSEGNDNTAWLLMNLLLLSGGFCAVTEPPARKAGYCKALADSRQQNDMEPFSKFIAECVMNAVSDQSVS